MKPTIRAADFKFPKKPPASDVDDADPTASHSGFIIWLKHLALYLGAVVVAAMIGLHFLWQIPVLQDPTHLFKNIGDTAPPKAPPTTTSPAPSAGSPSVASQPPANPTPTSATMPTEPTGDFNAASPSTEQPTTPVAEDQTTPPAETVPLTPQAEVEQLLTDAQQQMGNRRFTAPASGNALSTYRRVLELQPNHPAALEGIQRITTYYRDVAQQSLQQGRLDESLAYINRGLRASPKSDALLSLRRNVQKAKQREQEEQQVLLENLQRQQEEQARVERFRQEHEQQQQQPWWRKPAQQDQDSGFNQR